MVLKKDFYFDKPKDENVDEQVEEVKEDEIQMYDFTKQIIIEEATLQDIKAGSSFRHTPAPCSPDRGCPCNELRRHSSLDPPRTS